MKTVYKFIALLIIAALLLPINISVHAAEALFVSADAAVLIEEESGKVLFEKNKDVPLPMASTTKVMTAYVALLHGNADDTVAVPKEAVGTEGSSCYFKEGEKLSLYDMVTALLLRSANDAAVAIAYHIGGSIEGFAALMNKEARALGLHNTNYKNPHGLDEEGHRTTAHDLAKAMAAARELEFFCEINAKKKAEITNSEGYTRLIYNHNKLLSMYEGTCGGKTGFTKKSGRCLVSVAEKEGVSLIAVTLNAPSDWQDHINMLDNGFSRTKHIVIREEGELSFCLPIIGENRDHTVANLDRAEITLIDEDFEEIEESIHLPPFCFGRKKGDVVGTAIYRIGNKTVLTVPLAVTE